MAEVSNYEQSREVVAGRPNQVLSVTEVKLVAFRFTNGAGEVDVGLGFLFGKSRDGSPGLCVMPISKLPEFGEPLDYIKKGVFNLLRGASIEAASDDLSGYTVED